MRVIFCSDPLNPRKPDPAYEREVDAVRQLEIPFDLIDHDALIAEAMGDVIRRAEPLERPELVVFRGWMMKPAQYESLHSLLAGHRRQLINSPAQYVHCHHLPPSYSVIEGSTPLSVWLPTRGELPIDTVMGLLKPFGDRPVVVKDYVKSQKHEWKQACFIPSAADRSHVERVVRRFLELQGTDLNEGLVFREFVEFESVGVHPKSGMPLSREFRQFFLDGKPLLRFKYWDEGEYGDDAPPLDLFSEVAGRVQSRFFTMDVAHYRSGKCDGEGHESRVVSPGRTPARRSTREGRLVGAAGGRIQSMASEEGSPARSDAGGLGETGQCCGESARPRPRRAGGENRRPSTEQRAGAGCAAR